MRLEQQSCKMKHTYRVRSWTFFKSGVLDGGLAAMLVSESRAFPELSLLLRLALTFISVETSESGYSELALNLLLSAISLDFFHCFIFVNSNTGKGAESKGNGKKRKNTWNVTMATNKCHWFTFSVAVFVFWLSHLLKCKPLYFFKFLILRFF